MSGANRLASSDSGGRNTGALTCPSPLAALQDVEGISILLSRTRESFLSEAVRKFVDRLRPPLQELRDEAAVYYDQRSQARVVAASLFCAAALD